ncbi:MAG: PKD domain-containing protein, partial [Acidobacteriota bacterium]|nr:PKD domain-containing protein [Acidobacteriota bacterium]
MWTRSRRIIGMLALALAAASCTVKDTEAPGLAGPSELALSLSIQAVPDTVIRDGFSQATVTIDARGPSSQPAGGVAVRFDMLVDGQVGDLGTLSARTVVTGNDGRASVTYTAPRQQTGPDTRASIVTLTATPVGGDYRGEVARQVDIRVMPRGTILPPNRINAVFTYSPTTVTAYDVIGFDASNSTDNAFPCGANCTYDWSFGDGGSSTGVTTTHEFRAAGTYVVTLRVANADGQMDQATQAITVAAGTPPVARFVYSPVSPRVSQDIFFTAEASRAAEGRRIVAYDWNFGSGRTGTGVTVAKRYDTLGSYVVTLTV